MTTPRPHPDFDDHGTLDWHTRYDQALAVARATRRKVFVEMGRLQCGQCRTLVQAIVPRPDVAPLLQQHFVALASDADDPEDALIELVQEHMEDASMLPFVFFVDADGKFIEGADGAVNPNTFRSVLERVAKA